MKISVMENASFLLITLNNIKRTLKCLSVLFTAFFVLSVKWLWKCRKRIIVFFKKYKVKNMPLSKWKWPFLVSQYIFITIYVCIKSKCDSNPWYLRCDFIWKWSIYRGNGIKIMLLRWTLSNLISALMKKRNKRRDRKAQRKDRRKREKIAMQLERCIYKPRNARS